MRPFVTEIKQQAAVIRLHRVANMKNLIIRNIDLYILMIIYYDERDGSNGDSLSCINGDADGDDQLYPIRC